MTQQPPVSTRSQTASHRPPARLLLPVLVFGMPALALTPFSRFLTVYSVCVALLVLPPLAVALNRRIAVPAAVRRHRLLQCGSFYFVYIALFAASALFCVLGARQMRFAAHVGGKNLYAPALIGCALAALWYLFLLLDRLFGLASYAMQYLYATAIGTVCHFQPLLHRFRGAGALAAEVTAAAFYESLLLVSVGVACAAVAWLWAWAAGRRRSAALPAAAPK